MSLDEFWRNQLNRACYFCGHADTDHPYDTDPMHELRGRCTKCKECPAYHWDYVSALEQLLNELRSGCSASGQQEEPKAFDGVTRERTTAA